MELEKKGNGLPDYCQRVWAQVDLEAMEENMRGMRASLEAETKLLAVVKADAYGHGSVPVARRLETMPFVAGFAVATAEEAFALRQGGLQKPILVLGYTFPYTYQKLIEEEIRPTVFRLDMIDELGKAARRLGKTAKVHVKVETGMNRIGIRPDKEGISFIRRLLEERGIQLEGIFTHFAKADQADKSNAECQLETFRSFLHMIKGELSFDIPIKHCANSAAILEMPQAQMDMVRAGIAMYGLYPSDEMRRDHVCLRPVLSLYSHVVYVKTVECGEAIGYGGTFTAERQMRIATIPVGYGDGYPRSLSGRGFCLIRGKKAPILGRICMDQFMVDVSHIPQAIEGDRVVLLGRDGDLQIDAGQLGELSGRFHYELLCDLGKRIPRIYTENDRIL